MTDKTKTVTLNRAHRHAGVDYAEGDKVEVTPREEAKLQLAGVIGAKPKADSKAETKTDT